MDLTGRQFGRLTIRWPVAKALNKGVVWLCQCECGKLKNVLQGNLINSSTKSCGCLRNEGVRPKHGESRRGKVTPEYMAWHSAKMRCKHKSVEGYEHYGGRGIQFRFKSYKEFITAIGRRPTPQHSLDRIDNDGHYEVGNVRWGTREQQQTNRRKWKLERCLCSVCGRNCPTRRRDSGSSEAFPLKHRQYPNLIRVRRAVPWCAGHFAPGKFLGVREASA